MQPSKFSSLEDRVAQIINTIDPLDLISEGAPMDEYTSEISQILAQLSTVKQKEDLRSIVDNIFFKAFDIHIDKQKLDAIVNEVSVLIVT